MRKEETTSPTVCTDSVFITATIKAAENRCTVVVDLTGAHLSADMGDEEEVLIVMQGDLAEMMAPVAPETCLPHAWREKKTLYVKLCKVLYSCLKLVLLFYRKLWAELHDNDFVMNPYDPCICNKIVNGKQMTIT